MRNIVNRALLVIFTFFAFNANAFYPDGFVEYKMRATFMYNLMAFVKWKNVKVPTICVYGYDSASNYLERLSLIEFEGRKVNVKKKISDNEINLCNALYISKNQKKNLKHILSIVEYKPILTMSDIENFTTIGGMLGFVLIRDKVTIRLNRWILQDSGISISPMLLSIIPKEGWK